MIISDNTSGVTICENTTDGGRILIKGILSPEQEKWIRDGIWRVLPEDEVKRQYPDLEEDLAQ